MPRDLYEVLGLTRSATADEIKKAYRKLAAQYHPDRNPGNPDAEAKFKEVSGAYEVLADEQRKSKYDQFGFTGNESGGFPGGGAGADSAAAEELFRTFFSGQAPGAGNTEGFDLGGLFGNAGARRGARGRGTRQPPPQPDVESDIRVPFLTAAVGGSVGISVGVRNIDVKVPAGIEEGKRLRVPASATGSADVYLRVHIDPHPYFRREASDIYLEVPITVSEAVLGTKVDVPTLDGSTLSVRVPACTSSGSKLRLRGKGIGSGDQYLIFKIVVPPTIDERTQELMKEYAEHNPQDPREKMPWK